MIGASIQPNRLHYTDLTFQAASIELAIQNEFWSAAKKVTKTRLFDSTSGQICTYGTPTNPSSLAEKEKVHSFFINFFINTTTVTNAGVDFFTFRRAFYKQRA